ncbi:hypothetical protein Tcan_01634, partial [Toxocara canis]
MDRLFILLIDRVHRVGIVEEETEWICLHMRQLTCIVCGAFIADEIFCCTMVDYKRTMFLIAAMTSSLTRMHRIYHLKYNRQTFMRNSCDFFFIRFYAFFVVDSPCNKKESPKLRNAIYGVH